MENGGKIRRSGCPCFLSLFSVRPCFLSLKDDCAALYGPEDSGKNALNSAEYSLEAVFKHDSRDFDMESIAVTQMKDADGVLVSTGKVSINMASMLFFNTKGQGLSDTQFRAFVLLHELGHLSGKLGDDNGDQSSPTNPAYTFNRSILQDCFHIEP